MRLAVGRHQRALPRYDRGAEGAQVPVAVCMQVDDELALRKPLRQRRCLGQERANVDGTVTAECDGLVRVSV